MLQHKLELSRPGAPSDSSEQITLAVAPERPAGGASATSTYMTVAAAREELAEAMRLAAARKIRRQRQHEGCLSNVHGVQPQEASTSTMHAPLHAPPCPTHCSHCCYCCFPEGRPQWQPTFTGARWRSESGVWKATVLEPYVETIDPSPARPPSSVTPTTRPEPELYLTDRRSSLREPAELREPWACPGGPRMWPVPHLKPWD